MTRDLVETGLSHLDLRAEDREATIDAVTRLIGNSADHIVRELLRERRPPGALRPSLTCDEHDDEPGEGGTSSYRDRGGTSSGKKASEKDKRSKRDPEASSTTAKKRRKASQ